MKIVKGYKIKENTTKTNFNKKFLAQSSHAEITKNNRETKEEVEVILSIQLKNRDLWIELIDIIKNDKEENLKEHTKIIKDKQLYKTFNIDRNDLYSLLSVDLQEDFFKDINLNYGKNSISLQRQQRF